MTKVRVAWWFVVVQGRRNIQGPKSSYQSGHTNATFFVIAIHAFTIEGVPRIKSKVREVLHNWIVIRTKRMLSARILRYDNWLPRFVHWIIQQEIPR